MKLERFDKNKNYKKALIITLVAIVLLGGGILVYKTFALYETKKEYNVLEGTIERFQTGGNDITLAVVVDDKQQSTFPKKYQGYENTSVKCTNNATATWNKDKWSIVINNIESSSTICTVYFKKLPALKNFEEIANLAGEEGECSASGIAKVSHENADIKDAGYDEFNLDYTTVAKNLKQTEYRYCGEDPNNYVTFNGEVAGWRIIGLVNTPEGQRIKLIRSESIGNYARDNKKANEGSSTSDGGSNDWRDSALQVLLNQGAYYNRTSGNCPYGSNGVTIPCDFSTNGLTVNAKKMIDTIIWNLGGAASFVTSSNGLTSHFYNYERGTTVFNGRPTLWQGEVGLIYPSDYGYATSGGNTYSRNQCLQKELSNWNKETYQMDCAYNDWILYNDVYQRTITPRSDINSRSVIIDYSGFLSVSYETSVSYMGKLHAETPVIYLKPEVAIASGSGLINDPYLLK